MNHSPRISVIVPVRDTALWLPRCMDSILGQSFGDLELICVLGESGKEEDESGAILREYAQQDPRICIVEQKGSGLSGARNEGLDLARGEFISFVDSDDEILPGMYARLMESQSDDIDAICFSAVETRNGKETGSRYYDNKWEGVHQLPPDQRLEVSRTVWNKLFRRNIIEDHALRFPENCLFEDNVFTVNYLMLCDRILFLDDRLYIYHRNSSSLTGGIESGREGVAVHYIYLLDHIYPFWRVQNLFPAHYTLFEALCLEFLRSALKIAHPYERAGLLWELTTRLRKWDLPLADPWLQGIRDGEYQIFLGKSLNRTNILNLKRKHGLQKLLYLGNSGGDKSLQIFSREILRWKRSSSGKEKKR